MAEIRSDSFFHDVVFSVLIVFINTCYYDPLKGKKFGILWGCNSIILGM